MITLRLLHAAQARLIMHVGPHKVASTSTQSFLVSNAGWLREQFNVTIAATHGTKEGAWIANTYLARSGYSSPNLAYVNESQAQRLIESMAKYLLLHPVLLSAEDFEPLSVDGWRMLRSDINAATGAHVEMVAVMAHRNAADRLVSSWRQDTYGDERIGEYVMGDSQVTRTFKDDVGTLRTLHTAFGQSNVLGVSLELLGEENTTLAAFLVCNASLNLVGAAWTVCDRIVANRSEGVVKSQSLPLLLYETARLARLAARVSSSCNGTSDLIPINELNASLLKEVSSVLPHSRCASETDNPPCTSRLCELAEGATTTWFNLSGARRPHLPTGRVQCLVDESKLTQAHWNALLSVRPYKQHACRHLDASSSWPGTSDHLIIQHMPKSGGTSFRDIIFGEAAILGKSRQTAYGEDIPGPGITSFDAAHPAQIIMGHRVDFHTLQPVAAGRTVRYTMMVRSPLSWILSLFLHMHPVNSGDFNAQFGRFVESLFNSCPGLVRGSNETWCNSQLYSWYSGGAPVMPDSGKCASFVSFFTRPSHLLLVSERYTESIWLIYQMLGWGSPPVIPKLNVRPETLYNQNLTLRTTSTVAKALSESCLPDIYVAAREHFDRIYRLARDYCADREPCDLATSKLAQRIWTPMRET